LCLKGYDCDGDAVVIIHTSHFEKKVERKSLEKRVARSICGQDRPRADFHGRHGGSPAGKKVVSSRMSYQLCAGEMDLTKHLAHVRSTAARTGFVGSATSPSRCRSGSGPIINRVHVRNGSPEAEVVFERNEQVRHRGGRSGISMAGEEIRESQPVEGFGAIFGRSTPVTGFASSRSG